MNKERIMARMQEHLATVQEHFGDAWVGLFLQGSQNYKLDYESSDIDTKAIVLPQLLRFRSYPQARQHHPCYGKR